MNSTKVTSSADTAGETSVSMAVQIDRYFDEVFFVDFVQGTLIALAKVMTAARVVRPYLPEELFTVTRQFLQRFGGPLREVKPQQFCEALVELTSQLAALTRTWEPPPSAPARAHLWVARTMARVQGVLAMACAVAMQQLVEVAHGQRLDVVREARRKRLGAAYEARTASVQNHAAAMAPW